MTVRKDGGSAFPRAEGESSDEVDGMSLRDWFAGQFDVPWAELVAIMAKNGVNNPSLKEVVENMVAIKYAYADAMLAEREKGDA